MIRRILLSIAAALLATPVVASDLIEAAADTGHLAMFLQSLRAAGMVETLKGEGPFTLFAPDDNNAFIEIEDGGFAEFLIDRPRLISTLAYHLIPGKVMSSDITEARLVTTLQGSQIMISPKEGGGVELFGHYRGGPTANAARVISADIVASNGVIHLIDHIVRPPRPGE